MTRRLTPPTDEQRAHLRALADEPLPLEEANRRRAIPLTDEEVEETMAQVRWFRRRYPTVIDRLRYCDREYRAWLGQPR